MSNSQSEKERLIQKVIDKEIEELNYISRKNIEKSKEFDEELIDPTIKKDFHLKVRNGLENLLKKKDNMGNTIVLIPTAIVEDYFVDRSQIEQPAPVHIDMEEEKEKMLQQLLKEEKEKRLAKISEVESKYKSQDKLSKLKEEQRARLLEKKNKNKESII